MRKTYLIPLIAIVMLAGLPQQGNAIPAFSRRLGFTCSVCHWGTYGPSELTGIGTDFLRRGFRMAGEETEVEKKPIRVTDYLTVIGEFPFVRERDGSSRFEDPVFELWAAGPISRQLSFVVETEIVSGEAETEEFYAQWSTTRAGPDYETVRVGQFQPLLILTHQGGGPRLSVGRPAVLSGRAANGNPFRIRSRMRGLEGGIVRGPWAFHLGLGNGPRENTDDSRLDTYLTLERKIDQSGSAVGLFGYIGEAELASGLRDSFHRLGITGNYTLPRTKVVGGFFTGENDAPGGGTLDSDGFFALVEHLVKPELAVYARWDQFDNDVDEVSGPAIGASWWLSQHGRIAGEVSWLKADGDRKAEVELAAEFFY